MRILARVSTTVTAMVLVTTGTVAPADAAPAIDAAATVGVASAQTPAQINAYWTEQRMAQAKPSVPAKPAGQQPRRTVAAPPIRPAEAAGGARPQMSTRMSLTGNTVPPPSTQSATAALWGQGTSMPALTIANCSSPGTTGPTDSAPPV